MKGEVPVPEEGLPIEEVCEEEETGFAADEDCAMLSSKEGSSALSSEGPCCCVAEADLDHTIPNIFSSSSSLTGIVE